MKPGFKPENPLLFRKFLSTPFGNTGLVYRLHPFRLTEILLPGTRYADLLSSTSFETADSTGLRIEAFVLNYFNGIIPDDPISFWDCLDFESQTPLQIQVLKIVAAIPYGDVRTYKSIAEAMGRPGGARFIGNTMAQNPFPVLIPCHRVIRSDGTLGGFGGGIDLKARMLNMERGKETKNQGTDD